MRERDGTGALLPPRKQRRPKPDAAATPAIEPGEIEALPPKPVEAKAEVQTLAELFDYVCRRQRARPLRSVCARQCQHVARVIANRRNGPPND